MKKLFPYIAFICLTTFSTSSSIRLLAGGCTRHRNEKAEIKCAKNDEECKRNKAENFEFKESIKS